jgi:hypothetical protein
MRKFLLLLLIPMLITVSSSLSIAEMIETTATDSAVQVIHSNFIAPITLINPDCPEMNWIAISDRAGLEAIADNLSGNYYLTGDIDLAGEYWTPIGERNAEFSGTFDGQGHVIRNMTITTIAGDYAEVGLFGAIRNGNIKNVGLENTNIDIKSDVGISVSVGSIVGYAVSGDISNVYNNGNVSVKGGIQSDVGGIAGATSGGFNPAFNSGGYVSVIDSYNTGNVIGTGIAGGIVGDGGSLIKNTFNTGNVSVVSDRKSGLMVAGGIIGYLYADIINCFNSGNVSVIGGDAYWFAVAGGIFGSSEREKGRHYIRNSYNTGNVIAQNTQIPEHSIAGGIFGSSDWADARTIVVSTSYNSGMLTAEFVETVGHSDNFEYFDFEDTWTIIPGVNNGLPVLQVHKSWHLAQLRPVTRQSITEICEICNIEKQYRITRLFCTETGEIIAERRAAKRCSDGRLLDGLDSLDSQCPYTKSPTPAWSGDVPIGTQEIIRESEQMSGIALPFSANLHYGAGIVWRLTGGGDKIYVFDSDESLRTAESESGRVFICVETLIDFRETPAFGQEFFKDNVLIAMEEREGGCCVRMRVDSLTRRGDEIRINVTSLIPFPAGIRCLDDVDRLALVAVSRATLAGVTQFSFHETYVEVRRGTDGTVVETVLEGWIP